MGKYSTSSNDIKLQKGYFPIFIQRIIFDVQLPIGLAVDGLD